MMGRWIFVGLVTILFLYVLAPLVFPVAMGGVIAVLVMPFVDQMQRRKVSPAVSSAIVTLGVTFLILLPTVILAIVVTRLGLQQLQSWKHATATAASISHNTGNDWVGSLMNTPKVHKILVWITGWFPVGMSDLMDTVSDLVRTTITRVGDALGSGLTYLPGVAVTLIVIVLSVYFFLLDGRGLVIFLRRNSFFKTHQTDRILGSMAGICRSVILASIVSGIGQAVFESLFCVTTGVPNVALVALLVFLSSFIPLVGSLPVTLGVALQQFFLDRPASGIALLVAAAGVLALDNVIRPLFIRGAANLHPLLTFIAALGGLQTLGFVGVFLGPVIAGLFVFSLEALLSE